MTGKIVPDYPRWTSHPEFTPDLSAKAMLAAGVFDGGYFSKGTSEDLLGIDQEILDAGPHMGPPDEKLNHFKTHSGQPMKVWIKNGWINPQDPMGWFQWYCRFSSGRRSDDDERQINRWIDYKNRWIPKSEGATKRQSITAKGRQALLHWAIDPSTVK